MEKREVDYSYIKKEFLNFLKKKEYKRKSISNKIDKLNKFYLPLSKWIYSIFTKDYTTKVIGLSGGQGAGKSTITGILKFILKKKYNLEICVFSIDDFYKTKYERKLMSEKIHQLFLTRGAPGTHDLNLLNKTLKSLKCKTFKTVSIPKFDKSKDDRLAKTQWLKVKKPPNIIILEGWCVGAIHQKKNTLKKPLNLVEKKYDVDLKWRKKVNNYLKKDYKKLFKKIDKLIYLKVPNFSLIYKWRNDQEQKLKMITKKKETMSKKKIKEFIMYYERITKQMMKDFHKFSDITVYLDKNHRSKKIKIF